MKPRLAAFFAGALFGVGLVLARMTNPGKVIAFLDLFGHWDPSLAFVMLGAIGVHALLRPSVLGRARPLFDVRFHGPRQTAIDHSLVLGSILFGVGWGLGGFCPGPAVVSAGAGITSALAFVPAMLAGMAFHDRLRYRN